MPKHDDQYKLDGKSDAELREWLAGYEPGTDEYVAGIEESMRRVALMEEFMENNEEPIWRRERIAMGIAVASIIVLIIAIVVTS